MGLLDALGYVGDSLDKIGSRQLRGVLGGKPRELASIIPFSDRLGITDPNDIVSGRDLTDQAGITTKGATGFGHTAAGIGAEMLLDPTNLIGGGLLKGAFKKAPVLLAHADEAVDAAKGISKLGWGTPRSLAFHPSAPDVVNPFSPTKYMKFAPDLPAADPKGLADAIRLGPRYEGGLDGLADAYRPGMADPRIAQRANLLMANPLSRQIASEFEPGTRWVAGGANSDFFKTPSGTGIRLTPALSNVLGQNRHLYGAPDIPEMLQPFRTMESLAGSVNHLPLVNPIMGFSSDHALAQKLADAGNPHALDLYHALVQPATDVSRQLSESIAAKGLNPFDVKQFNVSMTPEGRAISHDLDSVVGSQETGFIKNLPIQAPLDSRSVARHMDYGSHLAVREAMAKGARAGTVGQGIEVPGSGDIMKQLAQFHAALDPHRGLPISVHQRPPSTPVNLFQALHSDFDAVSTPRPKVFDMGAHSPPHAQALTEAIHTPPPPPSHLGRNLALAAVGPYELSRLSAAMSHHNATRTRSR